MLHNSAPARHAVHTEARVSVRDHASARAANLDALRGVAILLVLLSHLVISAYPEFAAWEATRLNCGTVGVLIFFCVSGYVISWSVSDLMGGAARYSSLIFIIRRAFRLLPPYFVLATVLWIFVTPDAAKEHISAAIQADPIGYGVRFITLTSGFAGDPTVFGGLEWTLAYEVVFYATCAVYLVFSRYITSPAALFIPTFVLFAMSLAPTGSFDNKPQVLALHFEFFLIGTLVYLWQHRSMSALAFGLMFSISVSAVAMRLILTTLAYGQLYSETLAAPIALAVFLVGVFVWSTPPRTLTAIGIVSYSLYLLHPAIPVVVALTGVPASLRPVPWIVMAIAASAGVYFLLERPSINFGRVIIRQIRKAGTYSKRPIQGIL
jgi:peptidoglycan/LPS O-acetylase OafA/YrhL